MDINSLVPFAIIFLFTLFVHVVWAKYRIKQWALRHQYTILKCNLCLLNIGPFSYFGTSGGQYIFKIQAKNIDGKIRTGYARAGGFFFGLLRKRVEVKWDK